VFRDSNEVVDIFLSALAYTRDFLRARSNPKELRKLMVLGDVDAGDRIVDVSELLSISRGWIVMRSARSGLVSRIFSMSCDNLFIHLRACRCELLLSG